MSRVCELCGKHPVSGHNVSHSKRRTKRVFNPNLVNRRFNGVKKVICTACLRTLAKPPRNKSFEKVSDSSSSVA